MRESFAILDSIEIGQDIFIADESGGLAASAATTQFIKSMLYETQPLDLGVFAAVAALLMASAALACMVPAWRASRLDPMRVLRME